MKVLLIGANGKVGKILTQKLSSISDIEATVMIRKQEQSPYFEKLGVRVLVETLETSIDDLSRTFNGQDIIIFSAGSGGKTGYDKTLEIDLDGAGKSIHAAKKGGVKRFFMVSAAGADDREFWKTSPLLPYYIAKHYADKELISSGLAYTIIRPVALTDEEAKEVICHKDSVWNLNKTITREDVADFICAKLSDDSSKNKIFEISN